MIARYSVEHAIEFRYQAPVRLSVMTLYMRPLQDRQQVMRNFSLQTDPGGPVFEFTDPFGNTGHFLDRPAEQERMEIRARSEVEIGAPPALPDRLGPDAWATLGRAAADPGIGIMTRSSHFVRPGSSALKQFIEDRGLERLGDPLQTTRALRTQLHEAFEYAPGSTAVDSPIGRILETGRGVCQDYAHVMASILRSWGIPCRYVSGYLGSASRETATGQSHAWVECWFPGLGWTGFDPANNSEMDARHVRIAVGRDYADVPPTRGVYRGTASSALRTTVRLAPAERHGDDGEPPDTTDAVAADRLRV